MLGHDTETHDGTVKIVRPDVSKGDRGKLTTIGRSDDGAPILLREGWLQPNSVSRLITADFAALTGLRPVAVNVGTNRSNRQWFVVTDLSKSRKAIVDQTNAFTLSCIRARTAAGGAKVTVPQPKPYTLGLDENGSVSGGLAPQRSRAFPGRGVEQQRDPWGARLLRPLVPV